MPFTPAHSALVLPFIRINPRFVSATGLIIGSVSPDFEYFLKMSVSGVHGHTFWGVLYFDLPVSIALAFIFHLVVKKKLIDNLPSFIQRRAPNVYQLDFISYLKKNYPAFIISVAVGALSHIFWDSFTHSRGYFVNELPFYEGAYIHFVDGVDYPLWYALQHISTFVGMLVLIVYVLLMRQHNVVVASPSWRYWSFVLILFIIVILIRFDFDPLHSDIGNLVVSTISAMCISFIIAGLVPLRTTTHG